MQPLALRLPDRERGDVNDLDDLEGFDDNKSIDLQPKSRAQGTVKRLGGPAKLERWDEDDFSSTSGQPVLALTRGANLVGDEAIDWDADFDDRESTLKPGNKVTVKAVMAQGTIRNSLAGSRKATTAAPPAEAEDDDDDMDAAFALPDTLSNLNLATRAADVQEARRRAQSTPHSLRHRSSLSSIVSSNAASSDWDSPKAGEAHKTGKHADRSSIGGASSSASSSSLPVTDRDGGGHASSPSARGRPSVDVVTSADEDEDIADGLIIPSATFFSSGRIHELNRLLDMKRKPAAATGEQMRTRHPGGAEPTTAPRYARPTGASAARSAATRYDPRDDDIEDGLVLAFGGQELTSTRLRRLRNGRALQQQQQADVGSSAWSPGPPQGRPRVSSGDADRPRVISAGQRWPQSPSKRDVEASQASGTGSRSHQTLMPPPATPSRLRHQASHSQLGAGGGGNLLPPRSPGRLAKKASMQELNEAAGGSLGRHDSRIGLGLRDTALLGDGYGTVSGSASAGSVAGSRLLRPTASSQAKERPPLHAFDAGSRSGSPTADPHFAAGRPRSVSPIASTGAIGMRLLRRPKGPSGPYGDGSELDAIEDLADDDGAQKATPRLRTKASRADLSSYLPPPTPALLSRREPSIGDKRKKAAMASSGTPSRRTPTAGKPRKQAMLIRPLGRVEKKTVGDMTWNPTTLRWEGNYDVLRDFDAQPPASRPALISHYHFNAATANLVGSPKDARKVASSLTTTAKALAATSSGTSRAASASAVIPQAPTSSGGGGGGASSSSGQAHVIGNMLFDPVKMCWVSTLAPEDDEPDPFADLSDDEGPGLRRRRQAGAGLGDDDDDDDDRRGGTITLRHQGQGQALLAARLAASKSGGTPAADSTGPRAMRRFISTSAQSATTASSGFTPQMRVDNDDNDDDDYADAGLESHPTSTHQPLHRRRSRTMSHRSGLTDVYLDDALVAETRAAERRHRKETEAWWFPYAPGPDASALGGHVRRPMQPPKQTSPATIGSGDRAREREMERRRKEEKRLWEIRNLAMRS